MWFTIVTLALVPLPSSDLSAPAVALLLTVVYIMVTALTVKQFDNLFIYTQWYPGLN